MIDTVEMLLLGPSVDFRRRFQQLPEDLFSRSGYLLGVERSGF
jgi:hypothetical protein